MWWYLFLNWIGWRKDTIVCMRQEDTWCWPEELGQRTEGKCDQCGSAIYFEQQNGSVYRKICTRCGGL